MPKALLDSRGLDRRPHDINVRWWYYEEPKGLLVIHRTDAPTTNSTVIPWCSIRASLKRHDAAKARKAKPKKSPERSHRTILRESGIVK